MFLYTFLHLFITILLMAIIARAVLGWVNPPWDRPVFRLLLEITEPILAPLRNVLPRIGMFDLSPLIAIIVLQFISGVIP